MAGTSIEKLSKLFKTPLDRLLSQLEEAGIKGKTAESTISSDEKKQLMKFITQKRKPKAEEKTSKVEEKEPVTIQVVKPKKPTVKKVIVKNKEVVKKDEPLSEFQLQEKKRLEMMREQQQKQELLNSKRQEAKDKLLQEHLQKQQLEKEQQEKQEKQTQKTDSKVHKNKQQYIVNQGHQVKTNGSNKQNKKLKKKDKTRVAQELLKEQQEHAFTKPVEAKIYEVSIADTIKITDLAQQMATKAGEVLKVMMKMGVMATLNDTIDQDTAMLVVEEMGHKAIINANKTVEDNLLSEIDTSNFKQITRPPIVTIMGHVDHGKTSILDAIRKTKLTDSESGGITQHIGAYQIEYNNKKITFLDTPGHAAFSKMRGRGANTTDIVILVVAADDGVMPQTIESIKHAKAADVPIIVAINKMDKESANPDKVKQELSSHEVISEDWGGDVIMVPVSAHSGLGLDTLLENILLQAEMSELQAPVDSPATGTVLEAKLDKGRGKLATILVQSGTLKKGDIILAGLEYGRIKMLINDMGQQVKEAGPSTPVEVLGLSGIPDSGDDVLVLDSEKKAKEVSAFRQQKSREEKLQKQQASKMSNFFAKMEEGDVSTLNIMIKADVRGSSQALVDSLEELSTEEVRVNIVSDGVGGITESDIVLAKTSDAIVLGFNVRADAVARKMAENEGVDIRYYSIIYNLIDDVKDAMSGLLSPELSEKIIGLAEVRDVFKSPKFGDIAGCMVTEGIIKRNNPIRVLRDNVVIYEGELESLKRFKDDVNEVRNGTECGIGVKNYNNVQAGDQIEVFERIEVARKI
ncbi:Translation initiation factor 2 [hydrothermal vent metagenome]|uniref:Translation initiation factor 2 n=1 Tax=hydrothermal vent metagenome TaxID=652676 RepID=A0A1W1CJJ6_9ZZZZ